MDVIDQIIQRIREKSRGDFPGATPKFQLAEYSCPKCQDRELVQVKDNLWAECECVQQKRLKRRVKSSQLDPEYMKLTFKDFTRLPHTEEMYRAVASYARDFDQIKKVRQNGIALLARVGELEINGIPDLETRWEVKHKHNSFGLGKTHLLKTLAAHLLKKGIAVLFVNDTDIMAELRHRQFTSDFENLVEQVEAAEVLIWDDLGKAKRSEWTVNQYYRIIDYRYRKHLPTCFSSNESFDTLSEKIGDAAASRLYEMCRDRLLHLEGSDYRLGPKLKLVKPEEGGI